MGDIHYIVDKLNSAPFNRSTSLLAFSEKSASDLLQLLVEVFIQISPKFQKTDPATDPPDVVVGSLLYFLKIVKYKPPCDVLTFKQQLIAGDKESIYAILKWVLPQPQVLEKRAFVGYYLSFPDMPEDLNFDPDVIEIKDEIKALQEEFIGVHKEADQVQAAVKDAAALRQRAKQLEDEKARLAEKVERAQQQVASLPDRAQYLEVCAGLRKQQDEEVNLSQQLQNQRQLLEKAEAAYQKAVVRLREVQTSTTDGSGTRMLETLQEEVNNLRSQVSDKFPKEVERRQKRLQAVNEVLQNGVNTEMDLQRLTQQAHTLHAQIAQISERRAAADKARQGDKAFLQVRQAAQMSSMVARKKEELNARMERLQEKQAALTSQYERAAASEGEGGAASGVSEGEWRQKYESMKARLPMYKAMKKELGEVEAEAFVLSRTVEVLQQKEKTVQSTVQKMERKQGVQGFTDVAADLEKVSEAKSAIDEEKGSVLAEISRTVDEINAAIKERKTKLAPQIKKLRQIRQQFQDLESEHADKKGAYDAAMSGVEGRVAALSAEVSALAAEQSEAESKYHLLNMQLQITDVNIKRVTAGPASDRLREKYQQKLSEAEELHKTLKEQQRVIRDTHSTGLSQIDMMNDLLMLLHTKLELHRQEGAMMDAQPVRDVHSFNTATANVMVL